MIHSTLSNYLLGVSENEIMIARYGCNWKVSICYKTLRHFKTVLNLCMKSHHEPNLKRISDKVSIALSAKNASNHGLHFFFEGKPKEESIFISAGNAFKLATTLVENFMQILGDQSIDVQFVKNTIQILQGLEESDLNQILELFENPEDDWADKYAMAILESFCSDDLQSKKETMHKLMAQTFIVYSLVSYFGIE